MVMSHDSNNHHTSNDNNDDHTDENNDDNNKDGSAHTWSGRGHARDGCSCGRQGGGVGGGDPNSDVFVLLSLNIINLCSLYAMFVFILTVMSMSERSAETTSTRQTVRCSTRCQEVQATFTSPCHSRSNSYHSNNSSNNTNNSTSTNTNTRNNDIILAPRDNRSFLTFCLLRSFLTARRREAK